MDYWRACIEEAFEDAGIEASDDQIDTVASWVDGANENYGLATGSEVATANYIGEKDRSIRDLKEELQKELDKKTCEVCKGSGNLTSYGGTHQSTSSCYRCDGQGRL